MLYFRNINISCSVYVEVPGNLCLHVNVESVGNIESDMMLMGGDELLFFQVAEGSDSEVEDVWRGRQSAAEAASGSGADDDHVRVITV